MLYTSVRNRRKCLRTVSYLMLTGLLLLPGPGWSQQAAPKTNLVETQSGGLKIAVLEGEGAMNNIKARTATSPAVEVRDAENKPIVGAEVVFQLPAAGPGGVFNSWMRTQTVRTDAQGQAASQAMTPNDQPGRFNIKVTAREGKRTASLVIAQSNTVAGTEKQARSRKVLWTVVALAAVGGVAGGIAGTRGDSKTTVPISITPGAVTVAGPK